MDRDELLRQRHDRAKEAREILTRAEAEGRDLTADDRARFDALDGEIGDIDRRLAAAGHGDEGSQRDGGELAGLTATATPHERNRYSLGREERFADWQGRRGVRSEFSRDDGSQFSLGRLVQRMAGFGPGDSEVEQRAQAAGADATGGVLVPESLAAFVIDRIRPAVQVLNAGATVVPMDSDELSVPRISTGVQGSWRAENAPVTEDDMAFERVKLVTKTLAVIVRLPYEMFEDMTEAGSRAIETELNAALAQELDRAALRGSGAGSEPRGVRNTPGVEIQSLAANGLVPTNFDPLVRAVAGVMGNAQKAPNATIYSPRTWETLALLKDTTNQPLQRPALPDGYRELVSAQVPENLDHGTSEDDTSEAYTGHWPDMLVGVRPTIGVRIKQLDQTFAGNMQVGLLAWLRADVQLAHPESFVVTTGIKA